MLTGGKRAKLVAIPGATDEVFDKLGYFERQTDDCGDAFVLRVPEVATDTYVSVESERATNMRLTDMRLTDTLNGTSTDTYVSVKEDESLSLNSYGEINTLYKRKKDKVNPVNRPHKEGLKPEGVENWKEQIAVYKSDDNNKSGSQYPCLIPKFSNIGRCRRLTPKRIEKLKIGESLTSEERIVLLEVLFNTEAGLAFDFTEKGYFKPEVEPPQAIPTIQHDPWQVSNFRVPKALEQNVTEIIKAKLDCGALERSFGPYCNPWFLVPKKTETNRLINAAQRLNAVTIKDVSLPPSADDFSEEFAGFPLLSLLDRFSGYDQCILAPESRDMTAFMTPFGLLKMMTLSQEYTN